MQKPSEPAAHFARAADDQNFPVFSFSAGKNSVLFLNRERRANQEQREALGEIGIEIEPGGDTPHSPDHLLFLPEVTGRAAYPGFNATDLARDRPPLSDKPEERFIEPGELVTES